MKATLATAHTLPSHPLTARFALRSNGAARLSLRSDSHAITVELGPGYSARIAERRKDRLREVIVSSASDNGAYVISRITLERGNVEKRVTTQFATKTIREDMYRFDGRALTRNTRWLYSNKTEAVASYAPGKRTLTVSRGEQTLATLLTNGRSVGHLLQSNTERADGSDDNVIIIGDKAVGPGKSSTVIGVVQGTLQYTTVTMRPDGTLVVAGVAPRGDDTVAAAQVVTDPSAGTIVSDGVVISSNSDGTTTVNTVHGELDPGQAGPSGPGNISAAGQAKTDVDGGFSSYTETSTDGNTTQRSSYTNDGQGNQSQTTVTYNSDGSFTIDTITTDPSGNTTPNSQTFNKDGTPRPAGDDDQGGQNGGDRGGQGSDGDHGGGDQGSNGAGSGELPVGDDDNSNPRPNITGAGASEFPADDGSDPSPRPNTIGVGDRAFTSWLNSRDAFLGGNPASSIAPRNPGDPDPANLILVAFDRDDDENDGGRPGGLPGSGSGDSFSSTLDLRPLLLTLHDPDLNPRALVAMLGTLAGLSNRGTRRAANEALEAL